MNTATPANLAAAVADLQKWASRHKHEPPQGLDFRNGASEPGGPTVNINLAGFVEALNKLCVQVDRVDRKAEGIMADVTSILAKVTANTDVLKSVAAAADALKEGQATIADEIKALKDAVAAGTPPDFSALDAAADEQAGVIAGLQTAIPANTPAAPPTT